MVVMQYCVGSRSVGILCWDADGQAMGGISPPHPSPAGRLCVVVTTPAGSRLLSGWPHPDNIREVGVGDDEAIVEVPSGHLDDVPVS